MLRTYRRASCALGLALSVIVVACASEGERGGADLAAFEEALNAVNTAVQEKRAELAALDAQIANAGEDMSEEELARLETQRQALQQEVNTLADDVNAKATQLINQAGLVAGEEPQGAVREAILIKQHEDMLLAQDYIDRGGEYSRAIKILEDAQKLPLENPELNAALAQAQQDRYMDQERFAQVASGMSGEEVRGLLGTVHRRNRREYPERNVEAWAYRKEDGSSAVVYFEQIEDGLRVYQTDYNVVAEEE